MPIKAASLWALRAGLLLAYVAFGLFIAAGPGFAATPVPTPLVSPASTQPPASPPSATLESQPTVVSSAPALASPPPESREVPPESTTPASPASEMPLPLSSPIITPPPEPSPPTSTEVPEEVPSATPTASDTPTPREPTATLTRRVTPLPLGPNAFFSPSFISAGPNTGGRGTATIRGRVMDRQQTGLRGIPVRVWNDTNYSKTTTTVNDGGYTFSGLTPGLYYVQVEQHRGRPAENLQLEPGSVTVVEFVEGARSMRSANAAQPGEQQDPNALAEEDEEGAEQAATSTPTPEAGAAVARRRTPIPTSGDEILSSLGINLELNPDPWVEALMLGMAGAYGLLLLGLTYAALRRQW